MKEYKRLTKEKSTSENTKFVYNENGFVIMSKELVDMLLQEHNCLWEIENKIENGTLIEVCCKAGDKIYQFDNGGKIYESEIRSIYYANNKLFYDCGYFAFDERAIGETVFLTKAEAEAKLKELKEV